MGSDGEIVFTEEPDSKYILGIAFYIQSWLHILLTLIPLSFGVLFFFKQRFKL